MASRVSAGVNNQEAYHCYAQQDIWGRREEVDGVTDVSENVEQHNCATAVTGRQWVGYKLCLSDLDGSGKL